MILEGPVLYLAGEDDRRPAAAERRRVCRSLL